MKFKKKLCVISIMLVLSMLCSVMHVFAASGTFTNSDVQEHKVDENVFLVEEDKSKRTEFEKHYLCSDGTFIAVSYPEAIHYKNENNQWIDVDNSLTLNSQKQQYENKNSDFSVAFAKTNSSQQLISLRKNNYKLSWNLEAQGLQDSRLHEKASQSIVETTLLRASTQPNKSLVSSATTFDLPNSVSKINYQDIFSGGANVSVNYTVYQNIIEEDIIINEKSDIQSFILNVSTTELIPVVNRNNSVDFLDHNQEMQFHIGIPYMVDANEEVLSDIEVTVEQTSSGYLICYTPNSDWLNSSDRVYPIMLDPSITTNEYSTTISDTYVAENDYSNHSSEQKMYVGIKNQNISRLYIKLNQLPAIDSSMPIIGATMSLRLWYGTSTGRQVSVYKAASAWDENTITFSNQPAHGTLLSTSNFNSSTLMHTFDLTSNIARLYDEYFAEANNGYCVRYTDESKTNPDYNSIYSSEMTTVSYKPYITIKYGYALPTGLKDGGIYSLQNAGSMSFATVHNSEDSNNTNVYQYFNYIEDITTNQKFRLEYVSETGGYRFRSLISSNGTDKVLDIARQGGDIYSGINVQLYAPTDPKAQEWLIVGANSGTYKIIPRTNMSLALTTTESSNNGTASGTSSISDGNIFVSTISDNSYQEWYIVEDGKYVWYNNLGLTVATGQYYFNNKYTAKYANSSGFTINQTSGLIADLGNRIRWQVTHLGGKEYTIQSADSLMYLTASNDTSSTSVAMLPLIDETIPNTYRWTITAAAQGGCLIKNVHTQKYLYASGYSVSSTSSLGTVGTASYSQKVWRTANVNYYGNTSNHEARELISFTINQINLDIGESMDPKIVAYPSNAIWASPQDMQYSGCTQFKVDSNTGTIIAKQSGTWTQYATHKVTNEQARLSVTVSTRQYSVTYTAGNKYHITYVLAHGSGSVLNASWNSSNPAVATINSSGIVTTIKAGTTYITATSPSGLEVFRLLVYVVDKQ